MSYLKKFIKGGLIVLLLNFIIVNVLTLYYGMSQIDVHFKLKLLNIPLLSIERTSDEFGYVFMGAGMLLSILIGGIVALIIYNIFQQKNSFFSEKTKQ